MALQPEFCGNPECNQPLSHDETVVEVMRRLRLRPEQQDELKVDVPTSTEIYHPDHVPRQDGTWEEIYRGPLSGIRPGVTDPNPTA